MGSFFLQRDIVDPCPPLLHYALSHDSRLALATYFHPETAVAEGIGGLQHHLEELVSERTRAERLFAEGSRLEHANKAKSVFHHMSQMKYGHPLNAILGFDHLPGENNWTV